MRNIALTTLLVLISLWITNFLNISLPISITTRTIGSELSVVGEGKVNAVPDTANVSAGITVSNAKTANEAETKISDVNNKIVAALSQLGIDKKDIQTSNFSVNPAYNYQIPSDPNTISGYTGTATLTIKVRKVDDLPKVITAATEAGANQVYNNGFSIENPEKFREEARNMAIKNAREQAEKLARQLGIKLGKVVNISESTNGSSPMPYRAEAMLDAGMTKGPDLQPGSQTVTSTVTLYFERK